MEEIEKRLVEKEIEADKQLYLVVALIAYSCDGEYFDDFDAFMVYWRKQLKELEKHPGWKNGSHEGDCTKVPVSCLRCIVENWVDEAKEMIQKYITPADSP